MIPTMKVNSIMACIAICVWFLGCKQMESTYSDYVVPGGIKYTAKATDPFAYSGNKRAMINWLRGADPSVVSAKIFWNNYTDSLEMAVPPSDDTIRAVIEGLEERFYSFIIKTYDAKGNFSAPVEVTSFVYGDSYQSSLLNRTILDLERDVLGTIHVYLGNADIANGAAETEFLYEDTSGELVVARASSSASKAVLPNVSASATGFSYRTVFLPDSNCIDTFFTALEDHPFGEIPLLEEEIPKIFSLLQLPGDSWEPEVPHQDIPKIWDGVVNDAQNIFAAPNPTLPQWFTVDLNQTAVFSRMKLFQRTSHPYHAVWVKSFEIWGTEAYDPDGSWDSWTLLGKFDSRIPSGSVWPSHTPADMDYQRDGEGFTFEQPQIPVRYIRMKVVDTYGGGKYQFGEFTFWGQVL